MCPFYSCGCLKGSERDQRDLWTPTKKKGFLKKSGPVRTTGNSPKDGQSSHSSGSLSTGVSNLKSGGKSSAARGWMRRYDCLMVTSATPAMSPISVEASHQVQQSGQTANHLPVLLLPWWSKNKGIRMSMAPKSLTFLGLLLCRRLWGHVDGCCGHRDGAPARHQVKLHRLPGDERGRHLHLFGQPQVWAEARHEVAGGDEVHAGFQSFQDQLEAPANLFLGDPGDGADFCTGKEISYSHTVETHLPSEFHPFFQTGSCLF